MAVQIKDNKEEMIQRIKDCGQYIIDNAATILGDEKYLRDLFLTLISLIEVNRLISQSIKK